MLDHQLDASKQHRRRVRLPAIVITSVLVLGACDWTMFRSGPDHTGTNPVESKLGATTVAGLKLAWSAALGGAVYSSPSVVGGIAYVSAYPGGLAAFDAAGTTGCSGAPRACTPLWTGDLGPIGALSSPAVVDHVVYVSTASGTLAAFDAAGIEGCSGTPTTCAPRWSASLGGGAPSYGSPVVAGGVVYVGSSDHRLYAFDATGAAGCGGVPRICAPLWTATTGGAIHSTPAVVDGTVYVGSDDDQLYAFDATGTFGCGGVPKTCAPRWRAPTGGPVFSSPAVADGTVYVGSLDGSLYAFDATGAHGCSGTPTVCTPRWRATTGAPVYASPAIAHGTVYLGSDLGKLFAFDAAGVDGCTGNPTTCTPRWSAKLGGALRSSPAVANGIVYVGSFNGRIYALDAAGCAPETACVPRWSAATGAAIFASPAVSNGGLYVGATDGHVHAFRSSPSDLVATLAIGGIDKAVTTTTAGQNARFTFTGTAGRRIAARLSEPDDAPVTIVNPDSTPLWSGPPGLADGITLWQTGTYTIRFDRATGGPATVGAQLLSTPDVVGTVAIGGVAKALTTTTAGQNARFTFTGTTGQQVTGTITLPGPTAAVSITTPDGALLWTSAGTGTTRTTGPLPLPQTGSYTLRIDPAAATVGPITAQLAVVGDLVTAAGDPALAPRDTTGRAPTPARLDRLEARAAAGGPVRVLVSLRSRTTPEGVLGAAAREAQRSAIAAAQTALEGELAGTGSRVLRRYTTIPAVSAVLDETGISALRHSAVVADLTPVEPMRPALADSTVLIGSRTANSAGFTGAGQTVAIVDTGVDATHPFLAPRVVDEGCWSLEASCPNGLTTQTGPGAGAPCTFALDACSHGTHVAGIAAGHAGSAEGVVLNGVAPGASIMALQVFSRFTGPACGGGVDPCALSWPDDQIAALEHVYAMRSALNIAAANVSIGGSAVWGSCDGVFSAYKGVIDTLRSVGIATVIASGNSASASGLSDPACISSAISVGSTTKGETVASTSNSSPGLSLLAPGEGIISSVAGGGFASRSGTSMAAPHVTGLLALMKQQTPTASVASRLTTLQVTGKPVVDPRSSVTRARICATAALALGPCTTSANDAFAHPIALTGLTGTATSDTFSAGREAGEPRHAGDPGGRSTWFTFTAPQSGTLALDTQGSTFDTLLGVYTGTPVDLLAPVASADDASALGLQSRLGAVPVTAGTTYQIAVDGYAGAFGAVTLHFTFSPSG